MTEPETSVSANYDESWKVAIEQYFEAFVAFFFPRERLQWKLRLIKGLYRRGYRRQDILEIFGILDRMMRLPEALELTFRDEIREFEEENQMVYISSIERIGRQEERHDIIRNILVSRFGVIDEELEAIVNPLTALPTSEFSNLLLSLSNLSREELLASFGLDTRH